MTYMASTVERRTHNWDGTVLRQSISPEVVVIREQLTHAAKTKDWNVLLGVLNNEIQNGHGNFVNSECIDNRSSFTPLHHAADKNAPVDVLTQLIGLGAFRSVISSSGERPFDIAVRKGF